MAFKRIYKDQTKVFDHFKNRRKMRRPGFEPGFRAWKAPVIATRPSAHCGFASPNRDLKDINLSLKMNYKVRVLQRVQYKTSNPWKAIIKNMYFEDP